MAEDKNEVASGAAAGEAPVAGEQKTGDTKPAGVGPVDKKEEIEQQPT